jgi:Siphovirus ReqiPepy6 Gp37-like protein
MTDDVEVSVWAPTGSEWGVVGGITYDRIEFEPRHLDVGVWSMSLPAGSQADALRPGRLVTTRFRDELMTWTISPRTRSVNEDGALEVTIGGFDALSMLGWTTAWPAPAAALTAQPAQGVYTGAAETVIRSLVVENLATRHGLRFVAPSSQSRGTTRTARPAFDNLLELVLRVAQRGGLGVRFGLATTGSSTRAELQLGFYVPQDRTVRVRLDAADGSLSTWELTETAPSATRAIVAGAGSGTSRYMRTVTTPDSNAAANTWGGHREAFIDGPDTFDNPPLDDVGEEALVQGAATTTLTMEAREPAGTKAFSAFTFGDTVTAVPIAGVSIPDVISAIRVTHEEGTPMVTPMFGDPDVGDPDAQTAALIRALRRDVQAMKINRKRGAT